MERVIAESVLIGVFSTIILTVIAIPPITQILHRAGLSRWWALLWLVPIANKVAIRDRRPSFWPVSARWWDADKETFKRILEKQRGS